MKKKPQLIPLLNFFAETLRETLEPKEENRTADERGFTQIIKELYRLPD